MTKDPAADLAALEAVCAALDHAARRQILLAIAVCGGSANAGYIAKRFSCSWPTVSRHLKVLEGAKLLVPERRGRERVYRLNSGTLDVLHNWLEWLRKPKHASQGVRPRDPDC